MNEIRLTTAIGTPLTENEQLHEEGLELHLADQWEHGIENILVGGSMGTMQMLTDETYRRLVKRSSELWSGKGELLVGAGDTGFARTRERICFLNDFKIDGVAVLAPYFWNFTQPELVQYFTALADVSKAPIYLYDLPVTGTKLGMATFQELAMHPNIAGTKVSCSFDFSRRLIDAVTENFRIMVAAPDLSDMLFRCGINDQLEGVWAITPEWIMALARAAAANDWETAATYQRKIIAVRDLLPKYGFSAFTNLMNARGIQGDFVPRPFARLTGELSEKLLDESVVRELIETDPVKRAA